MAVEASVQQLWVPSSKGGTWALATVLDVLVESEQLRVRLVKCGSVSVVLAADSRMANPSSDQPDISDLVHLHEPGVLHNLEVRYNRGNIYTYTGSILIACNPFETIPALVAPGVMEQYQKQLQGNGSHSLKKQAAPHVHGIAVAAYKQMLRDGAGQAILITGESGAGKTESCKLIMRCLCSAYRPDSSGHSASPAPAFSSIEQKVLESNPLLEAFGNAKTLRNDNSSRFGKYVELQFTPTGRLQGARVRTYLLERSRVVHVARGERCFHAFYQLCAGASAVDRSAWHLGPSHEYAVLAQSPCMKLEHVDDASEYQDTRHAMSAVGIAEDQQHAVFTILAAVLHLGNITWAQSDRAGELPAELLGCGYEGVLGPEHAEDPVPGSTAAWHALHWAASLLQVPGLQLLAALSTRTRNTPEGPIISPLTPSGACDAQNALAKELYARAFDWLVAQVNEALTTEDPSTSASGPTLNGIPADALLSLQAQQEASAPIQRVSARGRPPIPGASDAPPTTNGHSAHAGNGDSHGSTGSEASQSALTHTIGLLDIYGFESFQYNDLEQLCINYANEKLQQHFNHHIFKQEQAEYIREGVDWSQIDFVDNQEVLDLVEGRLGLLDLLDEQSRFPTATAQTLAHHYNTTPSVSGSRRFEKAPRVPTGFTVQHYAGPVTYTTDQFLAKNKDFAIAEHTTLLAGSSAPLVAALFGDSTAPQGNGCSTSGLGSRSPSASTLSSLSPQQQQRPLGSVDRALGQAGASKSAFRFDSVASQFKRQLGDLMAALHAMQPHYVRCIKPNASSSPGLFDSALVLQQLQCGGVMEAVRISCAGFPYRRPYASFLDYFWPLCPEALHTVLRTTGLHGSQATASGILAGLPAESLRGAAQQVMDAAGVTQFHLGLTKVFLKGAQAAELDHLRGAVRVQGAVRIQAAWRGFCAVQAYAALRQAAITVQAGVRARIARAVAHRLRLVAAAVTVQAAWRRRAAEKLLAAAQHAACVMQAAWRARRDRLSLRSWRWERSAVIVQARWRAATARRGYTEARTRHRAACVLQAQWKAVQARAAYLALLPKHHAAKCIQAAWRAGRHGERLREAFRTAALQLLALHRAATLVQGVWRKRVAERALATLQRGAQRRRFQEQLQRFQVVTPSPARLPTARSSPSRTWKPPGGGCKNGQIGSSSAPGTAVPKSPQAAAADKGRWGPQRSVLDGKDVARELGKGGSGARLEVLSSFKLSPLLELWQGREQASASSSAQPSPVRTAVSSGVGKGSWSRKGSLNSSGSQALSHPFPNGEGGDSQQSEASLGELLTLGLVVDE